jgi:sugar phosphate isomerase/epimerase
VKPCLHPSIVSAQSLDDYLQLAERSGYEWVDVQFDWIEKAVSNRGIRYVQALFTEKNLQLASFGLPVHLHGSEAEYRTSMVQLPAIAEMAHRLGATRCCTWLWPSIDESPLVYGSRLAGRLRESANLLGTCGIRLGLEFVGPHHLRHQRYPFVTNLQDLKTYFEAIHSPHVGLLLDSYHWYTAEIPLSELLALKGYEIVHVHLNDAALPPHEAHDQERILPGEGRIDLQGFTGALEEIGYHGPLSLEVLHRAPLPGSDDEIATRMHHTVTQYIQIAREKAMHHG